MDNENPGNDDARFKISEDELARLRPLFKKEGEPSLAPGELKHAIMRDQLRLLQQDILLNPRSEEDPSTPLSRIAAAIDAVGEKPDSLNRLRDAVELLQQPIARDANQKDIIRFNAALVQVLDYHRLETKNVDVARVIKEEKRGIGGTMDPLTHIVRKDEPVPAAFIPDHLKGTPKSHDGRHSLRIVGLPGSLREKENEVAAMPRKRSSTAENLITPRAAETQRPVGPLSLGVQLHKTQEIAITKPASDDAPDATPEIALAITVPTAALKALKDMRAQIAPLIEATDEQIATQLRWKNGSAMPDALVQQVQAFVGAAKEKEERARTSFQQEVLDSYQSLMANTGSPEDASAKLPRHLVYKIATLQAAEAEAPTREQKLLRQTYIPQVEAYYKVAAAVDALTAAPATAKAPAVIPLHTLARAFMALVVSKDFPPDLERRAREMLMTKVQLPDELKPVYIHGEKTKEKKRKAKASEDRLLGRDSDDGEAEAKSRRDEVTVGHVLDTVVKEATGLDREFFVKMDPDELRRKLAEDTTSFKYRRADTKPARDLSGIY